MEAAHCTVLVLGIGNLLWADEGFGVRTVEEMHREYMFPSCVRLVDGGTQGIYLVDHIRAADVLVVFDAIDYGLPPGTMKRVEGADVPRFLGNRKMSLHQTGFQEVIALAEILGGAPKHMLLVGVQPVELEDYGGSLRPETKACIAPAIAMAIDYLAGFGIRAERRDTPLPEDQSIASAEMALSAYEGGRPSADEACRIGDQRVVASPHWQGPADHDGEIARILEATPRAAGEPA